MDTYVFRMRVRKRYALGEVFLSFDHPLCTHDVLLADRGRMTMLLIWAFTSLSKEVLAGGVPTDCLLDFLLIYMRRYVFFLFSSLLFQTRYPMLSDLKG